MPTVGGRGGKCVVRHTEHAGAKSGGIDRNKEIAICDIPANSTTFHSSKYVQVSRLGLEPRTLALKVPCSTN